MPRSHPVARRRPARLGLLAALALVALSCSGDDGATAPTTTGTTTPAPTTTTTEAPIEAGERVYVWAPEVGDCFDERTLPEEQGGEDIILLLDCDLPHESEVFAVLEVDAEAVPRTSTTTTSTATTSTTSPTTTASPDGSAVEPTGSTTTAPPGPDPERWPGDDALIRYAQSECPPRYGDFSGLPYELSELEVGWVLPDEQAWNEGDRTLACTVYDPSGTPEAPARLAGSMAGSGR